MTGIYSITAPLVIPDEAFTNADAAVIVVRASASGIAWSMRATSALTTSPGGPVFGFAEAEFAPMDTYTAFEAARSWVLDACIASRLHLLNSMNLHLYSIPGDEPFRAVGVFLIERHHNTAKKSGRCSWCESDNVPLTPTGHLMYHGDVKRGVGDCLGSMELPQKKS